jgi:hypothetical protein
MCISITMNDIIVITDTKCISLLIELNFVSFMSPICCNGWAIRCNGWFKISLVKEGTRLFFFFLLPKTNPFPFLLLFRHFPSSLSSCYHISKHSFLLPRSPFSSHLFPLTLSLLHFSFLSLICLLPNPRSKIEVSVLCCSN